MCQNREVSQFLHVTSPQFITPPPSCMTGFKPPGRQLHDSLPDDQPEKKDSYRPQFIRPSANSHWVQNSPSGGFCPLTTLIYTQKFLVQKENNFYTCKTWNLQVAGSLGSSLDHKAGLSLLLVLHHSESLVFNFMKSS